MSDPDSPMWIGLSYAILMFVFSEVRSFLKIRFARNLIYCRKFSDNSLIAKIIRLPLLNCSFDRSSSIRTSSSCSEWASRSKRRSRLPSTGRWVGANKVLYSSTNRKKFFNVLFILQTLLISNAARRHRTVGEIVNLMAIDVERFQLVTPQIQQLWSCPYQVRSLEYFEGS